MQNLLKETLDILDNNGKSPSDVLWISSSSEVYTTWEDFAQIANMEYEAGYGWEYVQVDLIIAGAGWWLERKTYDGSEWWDYKAAPKQPKTRTKFSFGMVFIEGHMHR